MAASDIALMPYSQYVDTGKWMSPLKGFEYMASGIAIVCSRIPTLQRYFVHKINALLVEPDNIKELSGAVEILKNDMNLRRNIACQAKKDSLQFDWKKRAQKILDIIMERTN